MPEPTPAHPRSSARHLPGRAGAPARGAGQRAQRQRVASALAAALVACALVCCAPAPAAAPTLRRAPPAPAWPHYFTVLTLNAYLLPAPWFNTAQQLRARLLIDRLSGYDAIVFQELFDEGGRTLLLDALATEYPFATTVVGTGSGILHEDGGVVIVSRWPIETEAQFTFGADCAGVDCLADKGVMYARIVKGSRRYHLFGIHAQSDAAGRFPLVRDAQFRRFAAFVEAQEIPENEPVLLAGDFNVDCHDRAALERMLRALHATEVRPCGNRFTWDGVDNALAGDGVREFLDYVLLATRHLQPYLAWIEVLPLRSRDYPKHDLSDHYAVVARFVFAPLPRDVVPGCARCAQR